MDKILRISVIIITRKWDLCLNSFDYLQNLNSQNIDFEILLAEGANPSAQRNKLANLAKGDFLLFLDDDSQPVSNLLEQYQETLALYPNAKVVGGPSLLIEKKQLISRLAKLFFSSSFGVGPVVCRYNAIGNLRKASEKDLILCNLLVKRDFFLITKGFCQNLYPGEENEFLKNNTNAESVFYEPKAIVYREARKTISEFVKQMFSYGSGRSKHFTFSNKLELIFLVPLLFLLYAGFLSLYGSVYLWLFIPMFFYLLLCFYVAITNRALRLKFYEKVVSPLYFLVGHLSYGFGLFAGLIQNKIFKNTVKSRIIGNIKVHKIKNFKIIST